MSDAIMFRSWDGLEMRYATLDDILNHCVDRWPDVESRVWMQYIGKLDKNDKRIYEGDIVAIYPCDPKEYGKRAVFVIEKDNDCAWGFEWDWKHLSGYSCSTHIMEDDPVNYEVIGNIHVNPVLPKKRGVLK